MATAKEPPLQISCLGRLEIVYEGQTLAPDLLRKTQALLVYLALEPGAHQRDALAALLWSDLPGDRARGNLRTALSHLRRPLAPYVAATRRTIAFESTPGAWLDVTHFEQGLASTSPDERRDALALYQGDFLDGFSVRGAPLFEEWALLRRERLRGLALRGLSTLAEAALEAGEHVRARAQLRRLLALDPWREAAHRALMRALAASGDRAAALAQYERCRQTLMEELGVEPAPATEALYEEIKEGAHAPAVEPSGAGETPHDNLPAETTPFVGRREELAQIAELLADPHCRLLTLFGAGGIGKTRLALQAARQALPTFDGGVALVALETIEATELLATAIVDALSLPLSGNQEPQAQLLSYLRGREMLLVLDNFEHLVQGGELLVQLLEGAPGLQLLVTSQQPLNLYQEWLLEVEGLSYPPQGSSADPRLFDAVSLFLQRARRADLAFSLQDNEQAVAQICRRLLGMPLGIELAAAWVRTVPCAEIARRIAANLNALDSSLRNLPARHRSMAAVFDHSWDLLDGPQRQLLRRLSVFHGGFSAGAAQEVAGAALRQLSALADRALLRPGPTARYEIHPLVRQYAAQKLADHPQEQARVQARHAQAFAAFLSQRQAHLHDEQQQTVLAQVQQEIDNVRAGWQWALAHKRPALLASYLRVMASYYMRRGQFGEGRATAARAAEALQEAPDQAALVGRLLTWQARFELLLGQSESAERCSRRAVALLRPLDEPRALGRALCSGLGQLYLRQGAYERSIAHLEEGLSLLQAAGDRPGQAEGLLYLSMARFFLQGDDSAAQQALAIYEELGDRAGMARALVYMGNNSNARGHYDEAQSHYERALGLNEDIDDRQATASCLINLATIAKRRQAYDESRELSQRSLAIFRETGARFGVATALNNLGDLARAQGEHEAAQAWYAQSLAIRRQIDDRLGEGLLQHNLSRAALAQGRGEEAAGHLREALAIAQDVDSRALLMQVLVGAACYLQHVDRPQQAAQLLALAGSDEASNQQTRDEAAQLLQSLSLPQGQESPPPPALDQALAELQARL